MSLYLYGAGGHGKVVLDILSKQNQKVCAFVDDNPTTQSIHEIPVFKAAEFLPTVAVDSQWIVTIGDNQIRKKVAEMLQEQSFSFASAIHPSAQLAMGVSIADGTVVMANTVINIDTHIGHHVIVNTGATIDHDCVISDYCHIAPGCSLCGQVALEEGVLLGVGSKVCPGAVIGEQTICGAGSVILKSLPSYCLAYGSPAKIVRSHNSVSKVDG